MESSDSFAEMTNQNNAFVSTTNNSFDFGFHTFNAGFGTSNMKGSSIPPSLVNNSNNNNSMNNNNINNGINLSYCPNYPNPFALPPKLDFSNSNNFCNESGICMNEIENEMTENDNESNNMNSNNNNIVANSDIDTEMVNKNMLPIKMEKNEINDSNSTKMGGLDTNSVENNNGNDGSEMDSFDFNSTIPSNNSNNNNSVLMDKPGNYGPVRGAASSMYCQS